MKSVPMGKGNPCPLCQEVMTRMTHNPRSTIKTEYHYKWWDYCNRCTRLQHYKQNLVKTVMTSKDWHLSPLVNTIIHEVEEAFSGEELLYGKWKEIRAKYETK